MSDQPRPHPPRGLTPEERTALRFLIEHGTADPLPTPQQRQQWLQTIDDLRVTGRCGCGDCPSVDIETTSAAPAADAGDDVLEAGAPNAVLLLFITAGVPAYLELAPLDDARVPIFPPIDQLSVW